MIGDDSCRGRAKEQFELYLVEFEVQADRAAEAENAESTWRRIKALIATVT